MQTNRSFEQQTYSKVDRRLIPFLFLCYVLAYLDRVNVGFAKLQMLNDLSMSEASFAAGAGIFFIGYFFFEVPANMLLQRLGARRWLGPIMIVWGVVSAATMFVQGPRSFYALRFLLGVGEGPCFPAATKGAVELTLALHQVYDAPKDKIVWDVGHQAYAHKLLTGRRERFRTLRQQDGISGFPKRAESEYDAFDVGHSSTSISAALGMAAAPRPSYWQAR